MDLCDLVLHFIVRRQNNTLCHQSKFDYEKKIAIKFDMYFVHHKLYF